MTLNTESLPRIGLLCKKNPGDRFGQAPGPGSPLREGEAGNALRSLIQTAERVVGSRSYENINLYLSMT